MFLFSDITHWDGAYSSHFPSILAVYLIWALVPHEWLGLIGITYLPHRHWAITGPFLLVSSTLLCFLGYVLHHWSVLLPLTSIYLIRGGSS
ncbi:hypothetical protein CRM22_010095 [Opisthorchis felineus]|uniref:PIG-P domain-containing protein n=1 Tax=Opisthorchis felineus TaxID=147828 RepID=A0A4S2L8G3_OPIFE|nr:hypothetical protein CRM22_010095 [Opisthorchis felineus]